MNTYAKRTITVGSIVLFALLLLPTIHAQSPYDDARFLWQFEETTSTINDTLGRMNATEVGTVTRGVNGKINLSHATTGTSTGYGISNNTYSNYTIQQNFSFSGWFNFSGDGSSQATDISLVRIKDAAKRFQLFHLQNDSLYIQMGGDAGQNSYAAPATNLQGLGYQMLTFTRTQYSGTYYCLIYKNTTLLTNTSCTYSAQTSSVGTFGLFCNADTPATCPSGVSNYYGGIDHFAYWDRDLSPSEISTLWQGGAGLGYVPGKENVLTMSLTDEVSGTSLSGFCVNATGTNTSYNQCNTTGTTLIMNTTGTYNITWYNITAGNTTQQYFNVTQKNYAFTTTTSVAGNTSQARLTINAYRLYLNTPITIFNVTNNIAKNNSGVGQYVPARNGTNNINIDTPGNYSVNITCTITTPLTTSECNATGIYDALLQINVTNVTAKINDFSVNITNTSLGITWANYTSGYGIIYPLLAGYTYQIWFNKSYLSDQNTSLTLTGGGTNYTFTTFPSPSFNFTFYDEITQAKITENMTIEVINENFANNYSILNGNWYQNISIYGFTIFRYYSENYEQRDYILDVDPGINYQGTLYDINLSDQQTVTVTVTDTGNSPVENATVTLLRYFVGCNCYRTVQMSQTSASGTGIFFVQAIDGHYKWSVSYLGTTYFLSSASEQINSNTRNFVIDLGTNYYAGYTSITSLAYTITYNTTTETLTYTWNDPTSTTTGGCIKTTHLSGVTFKTYQDACSGGSTGSVYVTLANTNQTTYTYTILANTTSVFTPLIIVDTGDIQAPQGYDFGNEGIFLSIGILIVLVTIVSYSATAVMVMSVVGVIVLSLLGIMPILYTMLTGIVALTLGIIIFYMRS